MAAHIIKFILPEIVQLLLELRRERRISLSDFIIGIVLSSFMRREDLTAFPSHTTLAEMTGINISDVGRSIKNLINAGFITSTRGSDRKTYYTACLGESPNGEFPHTSGNNNEYYVDDEEKYSTNNNVIMNKINGNKNNKYYRSPSIRVSGENNGNNPSNPIGYHLGKPQVKSSRSPLPPGHSLQLVKNIRNGDYNDR